MMGINYEMRPLKRPKLGPPDVYPQEARQKEDELTTTNVKHGFPTTPQLSDEFGSARHYSYTTAKIGQFFSSILAKKEELNTLPDCGRKRPQVNPKDNFWPVTGRTKPASDAWFKDLASGKPLSQLAKKAPNFIKKEDIFMTLTEYQVAMPRAAWFIKLSSAYTVAVCENKPKKRQVTDPTTEWTTTLIKFLKDQLPKLAEHYHNSAPCMTPGKPSPAQSGSGTPSHNSSANTPGSTTPNSNTVSHSMHSPGNISNVSVEQTIDWQKALKYWTYCCRLAKYMLDEGLLDRHEFLSWIIDLIDKRQPDDGLIRLFLPMVLLHMNEFVGSELLSRRLAAAAARKAAVICSTLSPAALRCLTSPSYNETNSSENKSAAEAKPAPAAQPKGPSTPADMNQGTPNPQQPVGTPNPAGTPNPNGGNNEQSQNSQQSERPQNTGSTTKAVISAAVSSNNPVQSGFGEILNCPYHRDVIIQLATILQVICIECPTAMVWSGCGTTLGGSPLDVLPVPPSKLPMPYMDSMLTGQHRALVYEAEQKIAERSKKAESKWCTDKWQTSIQARVLAVLEALDRHCFDRVDPTNNLDSLYNAVFANCPLPPKDTSQESKDPEWACPYGVVRVLCEWAVSTRRWGEHRAMAAAALLERRQHAVSNGGDDKESVSSGTGAGGGPPVFQNLLLRFLDNDAPVLDESPSAPASNRQQFANLVHLFGELIRRDVFSHDAYMCTLISRGDLISPTEPTPSSGMTVAPPVGSSGHGMDDDIFATIDLKPKIEEHVRMDMDDSKIDDDLDKLLQHIKEDQQNSLDAPDSPKDPVDPAHSVTSPMLTAVAGTIPGIGMTVVPGTGSVSRHYHYTVHFPLSSTECEGMAHDANQRHVLLYGVGRARDDARHHVRRTTKEICKLFSKKFSIDVAEGGKIKKHSRSEFNFEAVTQKFQAMNMFEQWAVSWAVGTAVVEALSAHGAGAATYLPQPEHVAFALDLLEVALNVHTLIDVCIQILKELSEVEAALTARGTFGGVLPSPRAYTTALALYTVGALRRYHSCLLLDNEQTSSAFEHLCRLVKCVVNPGDCGSAERCVLAQLHDLYQAAHHLRAHADTFANAYPKIRQALYSALQPTPSNHIYNPQFLSEFFTNPRRGKIEPSWTRQIQESPANRYSFVCSAMLAVCREVDNDRVNELGCVCAEMTAWCGGLAAEWLGALVALCGAPHYPPAAPHAPSPQLYPDLIAHVDLHDAAAHDSLAVFTCILVARHCFSLEDFVRHAALPSLVKACGTGGAGAEAGARLTCHLLLRLFKAAESPQPGLYTVSTSPARDVAGAGGVRLSCDRHLLAAAHKNIGQGPVLATLKAILMVGDSTARDGGKSSGKKSSDLSHILGTSDSAPSDAPMDLMAMVESEMSGGHRTPRGGGGLLDSSASLSSLARRVLQEICSEEWVLQKCLQNPDQLYHADMLLDSMLAPKQAQRLLHMICYPESASHTQPDLDQKTIITRILENLEMWTLRLSWLDLQLMYKQFLAGSQELNQWLDIVAKAIINVFQQPTATNTNKSPGDRNANVNQKSSESVWLVAPLVAKLPVAVQSRVLKVATQVLENGWGTGCSGACTNGGTSAGGSSHRDCKSHQSPSYKGSNVSSGKRSSGAGSAGVTSGTASACACAWAGGDGAPLLSLVLTCLRGHEESREALVAALHAQLHRAAPPPAHALRLQLLGGVFDALRRSHQLTADWALLLVQLVANGTVHSDADLLPTVVDMVATLLHATLADDERRHYQALVKKLRKEIGDRHCPALQKLRQLLPLSKNNVIEVIACEPLGCHVDQKGNKVPGFDSDKKQGFRLTEKQRVSAWELVEGGRSPAPLSWAWFGATRIQRKPLTYETAHRMLRYHTHSLVKPLSYYLEPLPIPQEDLEADKQGANSLEQSPTGSGRGRRLKKPKKKPSISSNGSSSGGNELPGVNGQMNSQQQYMQQPWGYPHQPPYYNQQGAGVPPRAMGAGPINNQSKQALSNMLRQRLPLTQVQQMSQGFGGPHPRPPFARQGGMRPMGPNQMSQMQGNPQMSMGGMGQMNPGGQMGQITGGGQMGQMFANQQYGGMQAGYGYQQQMMPGQGQMMGQGMGQGVNQMGQSVNQMGQQVNPMGQSVNQMGQNQGNQMSQAMGQMGQMGQSIGQMGQSGGQMVQGMGQMGQGMGQMSQGMGQGQGMGPQGGMGGQGGLNFPGQQGFNQSMMGRTSQEAYMAQRQNARPQYMQAPNVTMGGMGAAPPYPRGPMPPQQSAQYQQMNQQRIRQQMMAMQQQQQQQQQSGGLVQHLQRQQYQPPPY